MKSIHNRSLYLPPNVAIKLVLWANLFRVRPYVKYSFHDCAMMCGRATINTPCTTSWEFILFFLLHNYDLNKLTESILVQYNNVNEVTRTKNESTNLNFNLRQFKMAIDHWNSSKFNGIFCWYLPAAGTYDSIWHNFHFLTYISF